MITTDQEPSGIRDSDDAVMADAASRHDTPMEDDAAEEMLDVAIWDKPPGSPGTPEP